MNYNMEIKKLTSEESMNLIQITKYPYDYIRNQFHVNNIALTNEEGKVIGHPKIRRVVGQPVVDNGIRDPVEC